MSKVNSSMEMKIYQEQAVLTSQQPMVTTLGRKSLVCAYLWAIPFGLIGAHRFYLGQSLLGLAYLFSLGFFGLGWLYDLIFMSHVVDKVNRRLADPPSRKIYDLTDAYALCLNPAGLCFGLHHFYLGRKGFGTIYCFTWGFLGLGWLLDILRLPTLVHNANKRAKEIEENPKLADIKQPKKLDDAYVTWILGIFGAHHFYLGNTEFGFAYLFTFGMAGVGWLVDFFRMPILVDRANEENPSPEKHLDDAYILTFPLGVLGLQHFHLGRTGWGIIYSLTFGLFGFGFLIDMIRMPYLVREVNEAIREQQKLVAVVVDNNVNTTRSFATSYQAISGDDIKKVPMNDNTASMPSPANFYHQLPPFNTKSDVPPPTYHSTC